jgi:hypothetical protein
MYCASASGQSRHLFRGIQSDRASINPILSNWAMKKQKQCAEAVVLTPFWRFFCV